jgi:membrane protease YdiL (CAAX protease family)
VSIAPLEPTTPCWRCAKPVLRVDPSCTVCGAPRERRAAAVRAPSPPSAVPGIVAAFGVLLAASVAYGVLTSFGVSDGAPDGSRRLSLMIGLECIDVLLVAAAFVRFGVPPRTSPPADLSQPFVWGAGLLGLAFVLAVNRGYHELLRSYLQISPERDALTAAGLTPLLVLVYCVQPAIVEELFFRHLALENLRGVMGVHVAVLVSSVMFGLAHIGMPFSIPVLVLVGLGLGYSRVFSGGLALPMVLHGLHNAAVLTLR